jgi:DNA-binding NtrC family response regulator
MILIVEDNDRLARLLSLTFKKMEWSSHLAKNGVDAYRLVRRKSLKCVLLDLHMPMINGMEFLSLVKKENIHVPIIIMTGQMDFDMEQLHEFPSVVGFIEKPFTMPEMVATIQECVPSSFPTKPGTALIPNG